MSDKKPLGLSTDEAEARLKKFGFNDVTEQKMGIVKKFLAPLYSPVSLMLLAAAFLSRLNGKFFDFYFIIGLYLLNYSIQKWQEFKADKSIKELHNKLSFDVSVLRDGEWRSINAKNLVPGDHLRLGLGSIMPADARVLSARNLSMNEAALTGESLPKVKKIGDRIYSGAFIATGSVEAEVTATGRYTNFGKTIFSIEPSNEKSLLEKDILSITRFLMIISLSAVVLLTAVFIIKGLALEEILTLDLSLIIAGIPIALPAVMAIILSIGAAGLAKKMVVVRRLSALQDLANVNLLLTDKTGTLTKNKIRVTNIISYQKELSTDDILRLARYAVSSDTPDMISLSIIQRFAEAGHKISGVQILDFTPYDSGRKRSTVLVKTEKGKILVSLGAPQVILKLAGSTPRALVTRFQKDIGVAASQGFRVLAVAMKADGSKEKDMQMVGLLYLADPLDESSKSTIEFMKKNGITVKMLTGDNTIIADRIAKEIGLSGRVLAAAETRKFYEEEDKFLSKLNNIAAFAEILPQDKYEIVKLSKTRYVVAATGDGINDLPALRTANVGIAVSRAVSALKSMADIVLLGPGLAVVQDAILEARKIFVRLYNYSVYRISESFRLIITILILGLWHGFYPLVPLQIILLAFLNDIPIISLAVDRVKISTKPSEINTKKRLKLSLLFGSIGVLNSLILFFLMMNVWHLALPVIQTIFFLKLTVSGHMLIYVAHTKERWFKFLPSKQVIITTLMTQIIATALALTGFLMPAKISWSSVVFVWLWAFVWMQISELMKDVQIKLS